MNPLEIANQWEAWAKVPPAQCDDESGAGKRNAYSDPQCPGCAFCDARAALADRGLNCISALAAAGALRALSEEHERRYGHIGSSTVRGHDCANGMKVCAAIAALCALEPGKES